MAERRLGGTHAFADCAGRLQAAGARLAALVAVTERELGDLVGRYEALPAAARFDPFAVVLPEAEAMSPAAADGGAEPQRRRRAQPSAAAAARPRAGVLQVGAAAAWIAPPVGEATGGRPAAGAPPVERTRGIVPVTSGGAGTPGGLHPILPPPLPAAAAWARAGAGQPSAAGGAPGAVLADTGGTPAATAALAALGAAAAPQAAATLLGRILEAATAPPELAAVGGAATPVAAPLLIAQRLARIAALAPPAVAAAAAPPAFAAAAPTTAPRAPSRLLAGPAAPRADPTAVAADAPPRLPGNAAVAPPADAAPPDEDDLVAAINRRLVDQAWLRGVDLR